jgi:uncharacterized protein YprB with RNaseH-like and TPR domain
MNDKAKILVWDIETRSLVADYGSILCIGWQWYGEKKVHVKSIHDVPGKHPLDDKPLVEWFLKNVWDKADMEVGWYNSRHDTPFLRSRALLKGLPPPKEVTNIDMWAKSKFRFKFANNKLMTYARHLHTSKQKYWNPSDDFEKVLYGDKPAMKRLVKHCHHDVVMTMELYEKLKPWWKNHPRVRYAGVNCRTCGSQKLQKRGKAYTAHKYPQQRLHCQNCGHWMQVSTKEAEEVL